MGWECLRERTTAGDTNSTVATNTVQFLGLELSVLEENMGRRAAGHNVESGKKLGGA